MENQNPNYILDFKCSMKFESVSAKIGSDSLLHPSDVASFECPHQLHDTS